MAEVLANDAEALCVRFVAAHQSQVNIDITLDHPGALRAVSLVIDGRLDGSWLTRGAVTASSRLSLDRLPPKRSSSPQLQA
ncbi:MAG: hypothetical protein Q8K72_03370, partial [Acidimicrobiales bacterium]|nr:hypothetical protein [Acidimicrobiales bacterium]